MPGKTIIDPLARAPRRPLAKGKADGLQAHRVQTVLQCAPRARTRGRALEKHSAKRFQKHSGQAKGLAKGFTYRPNLFPTFFSHPLALTLSFCYTLTVSKWAGPSEEARGFPIPLRIERKKE